jgi:hypothetical protein
MRQRVSTRKCGASTHRRRATQTNTLQRALQVARLHCAHNTMTALTCAHSRALVGIHWREWHASASAYARRTTPRRAGDLTASHDKRVTLTDIPMLGTSSKGAASRARNKRPPAADSVRSMTCTRSRLAQNTGAHTDSNVRARPSAANGSTISRLRRALALSATNSRRDCRRGRS